MRSHNEIQEAHDILTALILDAIPGHKSVFHPKDISHIETACNVLCWVLQHQYNTTFSNNMKKIKDKLKEHGVRIIDTRNN